MNWRLFGWLAALFGGAIIVIWIVASLIGFIFGALGFLIKAALVVGIIGVIGWLGYKGYKAVGGSERRQIRK
ncbi:hypothetical protein ACFQS3_05555 [Glycomyces mayteni]|uniref:Uncharacterized protein n=1 Tax=Glycomyces mayteni TaxID=543887 RepID=A0ABW2D5D4_9ACTN